MKKILSVLTTVLAAAVLAGADFTMDSGLIQAGFNTRGGGIRKLQWKRSKKLMNDSPIGSFTERAFCLEGDQLRFERFNELEFSIEKVSGDYKKTQSVTLTAGGVASFDWLRITKKFDFPYVKDFFTVTYTLKNRDTKPHRAALWLQTYLGPRDDTGARVRIFQPRNGKLFEMTNPGSAVTNEWSSAPGLSVLGVCDKEDPAGAVVTLPGKVAAGYYSWTGTKNGKTMHTLEAVTRQWDFAPGAEITFTVRVDLDKNVPKLIAAKAALPENRIPADTPASPAMPGKKDPKWLQPKTGNLPDPQSVVVIKLKRQFQPSIRAVLISAKEKITNAAVYPVCNGRIDRDRPFKSTLKTLKDGSRRLLFEVPAVAPNGYYYTKIVDNFAYDIMSRKEPLPLGVVELTCQVALDAPAKAPELQAEGPELMYNGSFEKPNAAGNFADGHVWYEKTLSRKCFFWEKGAGSKGTYGIRLKQEQGKFSASYTAYFLAEPEVKYTFSADVRCENPERKWASFSTYAQDANRKVIQGRSRLGIKVTKNSYPWGHFSGVIVAPRDAVYLVSSFHLAPSRDNVLWLDNVSVVPEDFRFTRKPPLEAAREKAILSGYLPLPQLEKISHEYVTPHEEWFKPAAVKMPELLYACTIIGTNEDASRRQIVELAQRTDLEYAFIPLLPKCLDISGGKGVFGVNSTTLDKIFCDYSLERFRALKKVPKCALIQGVDFKKNDANGALTAELVKLQNKGTQFVFLNCSAIPKNLLGKKRKLPENWLLVPVFKPIRHISRYVQNYQKAAVINISGPHYVNLDYFLSTPPEYSSQGSPAFVSRDYPFWEYPYLPLIKALLDRSGARSSVCFTAVKQEGNALKFDIDAKAPCKAELEVEFKAMNRESDGGLVRTVDLKAGKNTVSVELPVLPGGTELAHCKLLDARKAVLDAAAARLEIPETAGIKVAFSAADRCYSFKAPVNFTLQAEKFQKGDKIKLRIEDTSFREVFRKEFDAAASIPVTVTLQPPFTTLNRVLVGIERQGKLIARTMGEFSLADRTLDPTDYHAGMWGGRLLLSAMLRDLGFDLLSTPGTRDNVKSGHLRNLLNLDFFPLVLNMGGIAEPRDRHRVYRADVPTDPVRNPCYSDPEFTGKADAGIAEQCRINQMRYYTCIYHMLGDEMFLGSTVCYSPHCLKFFREVLKEDYKSIDKLNAVWGRSYKSFDEVVPVQRKEVENSGNLAPWLDHKVFMSRVYAERFIGARAHSIQKHVPGAKVGMSGTQVPGYGYDWWQLMKHIGCIAYYSGVQTTLVNDFIEHQRLAGQWGGGYVSSHALYDSYERAPQWRNLFKGGNTAWNWHGSAYNGDGSPTVNLKAYAEEFNLLKRGPAKLLLAAESAKPPVAVLYSQASLFAAMAGGLGLSEWQNTQTGWDELLRDIKCDFRFISYENLDDPKFELRGFKVIVLPMALALSDAARTRLVEFASRGGTVIADAAPGRYDKHGKRIAGTVLDKLFPAQPGAIAPVTRTLNEKTLKGSFRVAEPKLGVLTETRCGKGRGILLNVLMNSYQAVALGGAGGETATESSGSVVYCRSMQATMKQLLGSAGITPHAAVTDEKGALVTSHSVLKKDGVNAYFGLLRDNSSRMLRGAIDITKGPVVTVKLPVSGVIYDVRTGKILARGNTFKTRAPGGYGQLFAVLPEEVGTPAVTLSAQVTAGQMVKVRAAAPGAAGATVYRLEVKDPAGKVQRIYSKNVRFATPTADFAFQIPFNARPGVWRVTVTHVASQSRTEKPFTVEPARR
ncbi:MAG: beta-galactosidase [Lentisphaeria bacterium]|nr:beta-galactosidase [Lentisphaeria bacterium]